MKKSRLIVAIVLTLILSLFFSVAVSAETGVTGWQNVDGSWYYYDEDGEMVKDTVGYWIGDAYYGFAPDGKMYTGWVQPYKNQFFSSEEYRNTWYYYGTDGKAPDWGYDEATGYIFYGDGEMATDYWSSTWLDGETFAVYYADSEGKVATVTTPGWSYIGGNWYYVAVSEYEGVDVYSAGIYNIDGTDYVFDRGGVMCSNEFVEIWDEDIYEWCYIYADANGQPKTGWISHNGSWYYLYEDGSYAEGLVTIGENKYYFYGNTLVENKQIDIYWYDDGYRWGTAYAKAGGALICNDWRWTDEGWEYYDEDCILVYNDVVSIGGTIYSFGYDGIMQTNVTEYDYSSGIYYYFNKDGVGTVLRNGWHLTEDGQWMYFEEYVPYCDMVATINGTRYAFEGEFLVDYDTAVWAYDADTGEENYYSVNADGTVNANNGWDTVEDGAWVYIENGVLKTGWLLDGSWYYLNPLMAKNETRFIDGHTYYFSSNGHYVEITGDGFYRVESETVYIENGELYIGWKYIGNKWYYFEPVMFRDGAWIVGENRYYFNEAGVMQSGGWIAEGPYWYYADESGALIEGVIATIDGVDYYFGDWGRIGDEGTYSNYDGTYSVVDKNGVVQGTIDASVDGWKQIGNNWYYVEGDYFYRYESLREIGGKLYAFDSNGVMVTNGFYHYSYYGADGAAYTDGWFMLDGKWYYADENGYIANGVEYINGKYYYFREAKLSSGTFLYDGAIVVANEGGEIVSVQNVAEGWNLINDAGIGKWVYIENGDFYEGWLGSYYVQGYNGMFCGGTYEVDGDYYYFYDNGICATNGWIYNDYDWLYAKADGTLCQDEWLQLGSAWYYFGDLYMVYDDIYYIDGANHIFDASGLWLGTYTEPTIVEGWNFIDGEWYYQNKGNIVDGILQIDGVWYGFNWDGTLASNEFITNYYDGTTYYVDANGVVCEYKGWKLIKGNWCYFDSGSRFVTEWFTVGGKQYYGENNYEYDERTNTYHPVYGIATGYRIMNGRLLNFASSGEFLGEVTADGWYQIEDTWCYIMNGRLVRDGMANIGGTCYVFSYDGYMLKDTSYDANYGDVYLIGSNGAVITSYGWHFVDGEWWFVDANGYMLTGTHILGGVSYYFDVGYYYY